jgi:hypothetical protein
MRYDKSSADRCSGSREVAQFEPLDPSLVGLSGKNCKPQISTRLMFERSEIDRIITESERPRLKGVIGGRAKQPNRTNGAAGAYEDIGEDSN